MFKKIRSNFSMAAAVTTARNLLVAGLAVTTLAGCAMTASGTSHGVRNPDGTFTEMKTNKPSTGGGIRVGGNPQYEGGGDYYGDEYYGDEGQGETGPTIPGWFGGRQGPTTGTEAGDSFTNFMMSQGFMPVRGGNGQRFRRGSEIYDCTGKMNWSGKERMDCKDRYGNKFTIQRNPYQNRFEFN